MLRLSFKATVIKTKSQFSNFGAPHPDKICIILLRFCTFFCLESYTSSPKLHRMRWAVWVMLVYEWVA